MLSPLLAFLSSIFHSVWSKGSSIFGNYQQYMPVASGVYNAGKSLYDNFSKTKRIDNRNFNSSLSSLGVQPNYDSNNQGDYLNRVLEAGGVENTNNANKLTKLFSQFTAEKSKADELDAYRGQYEQQ